MYSRIASMPSSLRRPEGTADLRVNGSSSARLYTEDSPSDSSGSAQRGPSPMDPFNATKWGAQGQGQGAPQKEPGFEAFDDPSDAVSRLWHIESPREPVQSSPRGRRGPTGTALAQGGTGAATQWGHEVKKATGWRKLSLLKSKILGGGSDRDAPSLATPRDDALSGSRSSSLPSQDSPEASSPGTSSRGSRAGRRSGLGKGGSGEMKGGALPAGLAGAPVAGVERPRVALVLDDDCTIHAGGEGGLRSSSRLGPGSDSDLPALVDLGPAVVSKSKTHGPDFLFSSSGTKQSFSGPIQVSSIGGARRLAAYGVPERYLEPTLQIEKWSAKIVTANVAALQALGFASEATAARRSLFDISEGLTVESWGMVASKLSFQEHDSVRLKLKLLKSDRPGLLNGRWVMAELRMALGSNSSIVATLSPIQDPTGGASRSPSSQETLPTASSPRTPPLQRAATSQTLRARAVQELSPQPMRQRGSSLSPPLQVQDWAALATWAQDATGTPSWGEDTMPVPQQPERSRRLADVGPCKSWTAESPSPGSSFPSQQGESAFLAQHVGHASLSQQAGEPRAPAVAGEMTFLDQPLEGLGRDPRRNSLDSASSMGADLGPVVGEPGLSLSPLSAKTHSGPIALSVAQPRGDSSGVGAETFLRRGPLQGDRASLSPLGSAALGPPAIAPAGSGVVDQAGEAKQGSLLGLRGAAGTRGAVAMGEDLYSGITEVGFKEDSGEVLSAKDRSSAPNRAPFLLEGQASGGTLARDQTRAEVVERRVTWADDKFQSIIVGPTNSNQGSGGHEVANATAKASGRGSTLGANLEYSPGRSKAGHTKGVLKKSHTVRRRHGHVLGLDGQGDEDEEASLAVLKRSVTVKRRNGHVVRDPPSRPKPAPAQARAMAFQGLRRVEGDATEEESSSTSRQLRRFMATAGTSAPTRSQQEEPSGARNSGNLPQMSSTLPGLAGEAGRKGEGGELGRAAGTSAALAKQLKGAPGQRSQGPEAVARRERALSGGAKRVGLIKEGNAAKGRRSHSAESQASGRHAGSPDSARGQGRGRGEGSVRKGAAQGLIRTGSGNRRDPKDPFAGDTRRGALLEDSRKMGSSGGVRVGSPRLVVKPLKKTVSLGKGIRGGTLAPRALGRDDLETQASSLDRMETNTPTRAPEASRTLARLAPAGAGAVKAERALGRDQSPADLVRSKPLLREERASLGGVSPGIREHSRFPLQQQLQNPADLQGPGDGPDSSPSHSNTRLRSLWGHPPGPGQGMGGARAWEPSSSSGASSTSSSATGPLPAPYFEGGSVRAQGPVQPKCEEGSNRGDMGTPGAQTGAQPLGHRESIHPAPSREWAYRQGTLTREESITLLREDSVDFTRTLSKTRPAVGTVVPLANLQRRHFPQDPNRSPGVARKGHIGAIPDGAQGAPLAHQISGNWASPEAHWPVSAGQHKGFWQDPNRSPGVPAGYLPAPHLSPDIDGGPVAYHVVYNRSPGAPVYHPVHHMGSSPVRHSGFPDSPALLSLPVAGLQMPQPPEHHLSQGPHDARKVHPRYEGIRPGAASPDTAAPMSSGMGYSALGISPPQGLDGPGMQGVHPMHAQQQGPGQAASQIRAPGVGMMPQHQGELEPQPSMTSLQEEWGQPPGAPALGVEELGRMRLSPLGSQGGPGGDGAHGHHQGRTTSSPQRVVHPGEASGQQGWVAEAAGGGPGRTGGGSNPDAWFRELLASGGSAFLVMDPQGRIQQGCPLFSHWLGYDSPDALVGHSLRDLVHPHSTVGADHLLQNPEARDESADPILLRHKAGYAVGIRIQGLSGYAIAGVGSGFLGATARLA